MQSIRPSSGGRRSDRTGPKPRTALRALGALTLVVALLIPLMGAAPASADLTGAIFTSTLDPDAFGTDYATWPAQTARNDCATVNTNIYPDKRAVYLNGGPGNGQNNNLPDGPKYVQVTEPAGGNTNEVVLGTSVGTGSEQPVNVTGGLFDSCYQVWSLVKNNSQQGYADTSNSGGEYKVYISTDSNFPNDESKTDNFKVRVPPKAQAPTVTKDAAPSFDRTYNWSIDKSVDKTLVQQIGGSATFNYTVSVTHDSGSDGNWQVKGKITITNPNPASDNAMVDVSDAVDNGGTCKVEGESTLTGVSVAGGGTKVLDYGCDYASDPSPAAGTNTATVSWANQSLASGTYLAAGSATGTADFNFGTATPNAIDETIAVTDDKVGALGTASVGVDPNPKTFTYSRTIALPANDCQSYDNTATFTTNDTGATGSDKQTVTVCGPAKTGALTIGFWKNTNGQNLIKTYCGSDPTGLGAYLRGLGGGSGPFSNATGNCSSLATYVSNILNGASATNMNNMLKAQMLSTALDVWFSGPGWTSTKSGAIKPPSNFLSHNNLGTFNMDTKAVCPMVDNTTTGTATCKNNTPSTDAKASGALPASSMSMQAILDFAATTPSPFNGSTLSSVWYGGDRTKQEILKNVYDQFNNQLAFGSF